MYELDGVKYTEEQLLEIMRKVEAVSAQDRRDIERLHAWAKANPAAAAKRAREFRESITAEFIEAYGGKCSCCGESEPGFLTVDHIQGGSKKEWLSGASSMYGTDLYRKLKKLGWPKDGYQLLCYNCNMGKSRLGECPHEKERRNA